MSVNQSDKEQIFNSAADLADAAQRAAYLDQACGDNAQLRIEIEELLRHDVDAGSFLEHPVVDFAPTIVIGEFDTVDDSAGEVSLAFLEPSDRAGCIGTLEHYEVIELVGHGGMGLVLKAFDPKLNRVVAIKVMAPELAASAMAVKRFLREARAAAAVSHDHVVTIHAIHDSHRPPFIVMEFVDGPSLQEKIDRTGGLELEAVLRIGMQTARGLAAAHEQGLVHRDIKPANVLLENSVERVKLTDFGLARAVDDVSITQTGQIAGTPQFMSPEQAQGQAIDARSDLFSLGSVLYTMCTGRPPFRAETAVAMLRRVTDDDPHPIREVNADIPDWLQAITAKLLAKDPEARFRSAAEVADLLSQHLAHLHRPTSAPKPEPVVPPVRGAGFQPAKPAMEDAGYKPATRQIWRRSIIAAILAVTASLAVAIVAGVVIFVRTNYGTIRVEVNDSNTAVTIDDEMGIHLQNATSGTLTVRAGAHKLHIKQGEIEFETDMFRIKRAGKTVVRVERQNGNLIARADGVVIGQRGIPRVGQGSRDVVAGVSEITEVRRLKGHMKRPMDLLFLADGKHALSCSGDATIRQWNVETGEVVRRFVDDNMRVASCLALSVDEKILLSGHGDGDMVRIWDFETGRVLHRIDAHQSSVFDVEFIPNTNQIVSAAYDNYVRYWDSTTGEKVGEVGPLGGAVCFTVAPDGSVLHGRHDRLQFFSAAERTMERELLGHRGGVSCVAISPHAKLAASASHVGPIYLWNLETGEQLAWLEGHAGKVTDVTFTPDGRHVLSGGWDRTLRVWDVATHQEVARATTKHRVSLELAVSPDGRSVLAGGGEWWDNDNKKWVAEGDFDLRLWRLPESVWQ